MKAVGADDKIEASLPGPFKPDMGAVPILPDRRDLVAEDDLRPRRRPVERQAGETAAGNGDEAAAGKRAKGRNAKSRELLAPVAHDAKLADVVAAGLELARKAHALGDLIAQAPEVDDISAGAQMRRTFDKGGFIARSVEPESECCGPAIPAPDMRTDCALMLPPYGSTAGETVVA